MIQGGNGACFTIKAVAEALGGNLNGDVSPEPGISCPIHLAHATGTDFSQDFVRTELVAGGKWHGCPNSLPLFFRNPPREKSDVYATAAILLIDVSR
jgi:hypothetical protein